MSKTLGLRVPSPFVNPSSLDAILVPATVNTAKLSGIVAQILAAKEDAQFAVVDFSARRVFTGPVADLTPFTTINAVTGTTSLERMAQFGDGVDRSAIWTNNGAASEFSIVADAPGLVEALLSPVPLYLTLAGLLDRIEDAVLALGAEEPTDPLGLGAEHCIAIVDQELKVVDVMKVADANIATVRALFADGGTLEAEAVYEQIPAEEAVTGTQAFGL